MDWESKILRIQTVNSDFMFVTGSSHHVCQDYAGKLSNDVVLSDGCSSSPYTDFGARFLVRNAMSYEDYDDIIYHAKANCEQLNLPIECLDATLLSIKAKDDNYTAHIYGDGFYVLGLIDGTIRVYSREFKSNAPYYLSYRLNNRHKIYKEQFKDFEPIPVIHTFVEYNQKFERIHDSSMGELCNDYRWYFGELKNAKWVAIMSDGVKSFIKTEIGDARKVTVPIDVYKEVIPKLLDFVNFKGDFVQRQMRWFLDETHKLGWSHYDDLSMAAIYLGE